MANYKKAYTNDSNAITLLPDMKRLQGLILLSFDLFFMRLTIFTISLILTVSINAQQRESIDFKYKKLNIPLVTSLDIGNQFFFFSSDNLLWFSTNQGLTSFDGIELQTYYPDTSERIKYGLSNIRTMAEDKNKNLWIAVQTPDSYTSLLYFDRKTKSIKKIDSANGKAVLSTRLIKEMLIDTKGLLWMSTNEKGFYIYNTSDSSRPEEKYNWAKGIYMTPHVKEPDKMWLCTNDGIYLFSLKAKQAELMYSFSKNDKFHQRTLMNVLFIDGATDSTLCIGTEFYGMVVYNIKRNTLTTFPPYTTLKKGTPPYPTVQDGYLYLSLFSVAKKSDGEYYVYYPDSLPLIFNCSTQKYTQLNNPDLNKEIKKGLPKLLVDKQDNLWIGESKYLYVVSGEFNLFHSKESPHVNPITKMNALYALIWDQEMKNYYATFLAHQKVYRFDSNFQLVKEITTSFPRGSGYIRLAQDADKNIWALQPGNTNSKIPSSTSICKNGSDRFDPVERIYPQLSSLNEMTEMTTDGKDILIFSNARSNLFFLNTKTFTLDSLAFPGIDSTKQFNDLFIGFQYDSSTKCVYSSNRKNIWQYNLEKKTSKLFTWDSTIPMKKGMVNIDASGQLWVQPQKNTVREIRIYDSETFEFKRKIAILDPRIENSNRLQILRGPKPYMFIMHDEGMSLYNYEDSSFRLFNKDNGLLNDFLRFTNFTNNTYFSAHNNTVQYASFDNLVSTTNQRVAVINKLAVYTKRTTVLPDLNNNRVELDHKQNTIAISFSAIEHLFPEKIQYAFRLSELDREWRYADYQSREIVYSNLAPGKYVFQLKAQTLGGNWQQNPLELYITIAPPFWQTWWFRTLAVLLLLGLAFLFFRWRIVRIRKKEQLKTLHEKELLELEAKALRAQMNPHFIFNSLNSIKSLINKYENEKAANYLTTFSKLIRTLFQNSDKREVNLFEEIETCKLYTQLERMRFGDKIKFVFNIDDSIDLKDIKVPALILQPFIENAIWHGLVPKETGGTIVFSVKEINGAVVCMIDDDGIGRELSNQYKAQYRATHESKGIGMTQSRLELDKLLNEREETIRIIDKISESGKAEGTSVIITFKEIEN